MRRARRARSAAHAHSPVAVAYVQQLQKLLYGRDVHAVHAAYEDAAALGLAHLKRVAFRAQQVLRPGGTGATRR